MKKLTPPQVESLLDTLRARFVKNKQRHPGVKWEEVETKLRAKPEKLWSLGEMEATGGEPDVVVLEKGGKQVTFCDCAEESPKGRRSFCYDREALDSRKE